MANLPAQPNILTNIQAMDLMGAKAEAGANPFEGSEATAGAFPVVVKSDAARDMVTEADQFEKDTTAGIQRNIVSQDNAKLLAEQKSTVDAETAAKETERQDNLALEKEKIAATKQPTADETAKALLSGYAGGETSSTYDKARNVTTTLDLNGNVVKEEAGDTTKKKTATAEEQVGYTEADIQKQRDTEHAAYQEKITSMLNGTFELSPNDQAQINSLRAKYDAMIKEQELYNKNYTGGVTTLGIKAGRSRYAGELELGNIKNSIDQGIAKVSAIESKAQEALQALKMGLMNDDLKLIDSAYTETQNYLNQKSKTIADINKKVSDEVDLAYKKLQTQKLQQDMVKENAEVVATNLIGIDDEGNLIEPTDQYVKDAARELGIDPDLLLGYVSKKGIELKKLDIEERKNEIDLATAKKNLLLKDLEVKEKSGTNLGSDYDKDILVSRLGKQIYGTKISDAESKRVEGFITKGMKQGKTELEIMDDVLGYKISTNKTLANSLKTTLLQGAGDDGLAGFDMAGLARLINNDQVGEAIRKVETAITKKQGDKELQDRDAGAKYAISQGDSLISKIESSLSKMGIAAGTWEKYKKKFAKSTDAQDLISNATSMVVEWRKSVGGTAITPSEEAFIKELMPSITDNPYNAIAKIQAFEKMNLDSLNSRRSIYGMPEVDKGAQLNDNEKAPLYLWEDFITNDTTGSAGKIYTDPRVIAEIPNAQERKRYIMEKMGGFKEASSDSLPQVETKFPAGEMGGQCGVFAHKIVDFPYIGDSVEEKERSVDKFGMSKTDWQKEPKIGDVLIFNNVGKYGHVAVINEILPDGQIRLTESNWDQARLGRERIQHNRVISMSDQKIYGAIRGKIKV